MTGEKTNQPGRDRTADLLLLVASGILLFTALGVRALWAAEDRWAEVAREMLLSGDFFHPTIGGEPYFDKPLLTYWLVIAARGVIGTLNEWAVRLPSAVSGLVVILATLSVGRRLWSAQVGRIAAWLLLTSYGFLFWARTGMADMENLAAITVCTAWYWAWRDRPGFFSFLVFYLVAFVGALTKGLTAVVVPVLIVLPDILLGKRWKSVVTLPHVLAFGVALAAYAVPFLYASMTGPDYEASGLALVFRENITRFLNPFDHKEPFYVYFYYVPVLFMPWAPLLVSAIIGLPTVWKKLDQPTRWLAWAAVLVFLFFTASGSRRSYYILPVLPLCALWTALFLAGVREVRLDAFRRWGLRVQAGVFAVTLALGLAAPFLGSLVRGQTGFTPPLQLYIAIGLTSLAALALGVGVSRSSRLRATLPQGSGLLWPLIAVSAVQFAGFFCWQQTILESYRTERPFGLELKALASEISPERIAFYPVYDATILFYLGRKGTPTLLAGAEDIRAFLDEDRPGVLVTRRRHVPEVRAHSPDVFGGSPTLEEVDEPWKRHRSGRKWTAWVLEAPSAKEDKQ